MEIYSQFSKKSLNKSEYDIKRDSLIDRMKQNEYIPTETFEMFV